MNTKTAYLCTKNPRISQWLEGTFGIKTITSFDSADIIVFPGGLDVDPRLYDEPIGQRTSVDAKTDSSWLSLYKTATSLNKKILGICKGSHFLTVVSGGKLYQHVGGHTTIGEHEIIINNISYLVNSTHHQMMNPYTMSNNDYEVLAYSKERLSEFYMNGYDDCEDPPEKELEGLFFKGNGALCIQFHPEFLDKDNPVHKEVKKWMEKMLKYTPEKMFDRYKRKRSTSQAKGESVDSDDRTIDNIPEHLFDEFIANYLQ